MLAYGMTARGLSLRYLRTLRPMIRAARTCGVSTQELFERTKLDAAASEDPQATLTRSQELAIYRNIRDLCGRPDIGLFVGKHMRPKESGALGFAQMACGSVEELIAVTRSYRQLGLNLFRWDIVTTEDELIHRFGDKEGLGDIEIFLLEAVLASIHRGTQDLVMESAMPTAVNLEYPDPGYRSAYVELFGQNVNFDQGATELRYPRHYADIELPTPDALVRNRMEQLCQAMVSKLNSRLILADEIKSMLRDSEYETPSIGTIARQLYVSPRSLHRHLKKQDTSYRSLVDEVRHERAIYYLTNTDMAIQEISNRCGFVEIRSFYAAFRRWTGMSPANYRNVAF